MKFIASLPSGFLRTCLSTFIRCILVFSRDDFRFLPCLTFATKSAKIMQENGIGTSIHAAYIEDVHEVPFHVLIRPFPSELEESKVLSFMETLKNPDTRNSVPPVDIVWITGSEGGNYYYSFGGCHRYEAHKRLGLPTIRSKLVKSTIEDLKTYLGGSTPNLK